MKRYIRPSSENKFVVQGCSYNEDEEVYEVAHNLESVCNISEVPSKIVEFSKEPDVEMVFVDGTFEGAPIEFSAHVKWTEDKVQNILREYIKEEK